MGRDGTPVPSANGAPTTDISLLPVRRSLSIHTQKGEVDRGNEQEKSDKVVPVQLFALKKDGDKHGENRKRYHLLNDLELQQAERPAIVGKADAVGRNHKHILKQCDSPREENHNNQRPVRTHTHLLQLKVSVPSKGHHDVAHQQQCQCGYTSPVQS